MACRRYVSAGGTAAISFGRSGFWQSFLGSRASPDQIAQASEPDDARWFSRLVSIAEPALARIEAELWVLSHSGAFPKLGAKIGVPSLAR